MSVKPDHDAPQASCRLDALRRGQQGLVISIDLDSMPGPLKPSEVERRLIEFGFVEGARVELLHEAFPGRDPIAVRIDDHTVALRRKEARAVIIALTPGLHSA
jgi:ferrous iron transport protein A